ncbi:MAG: hypothetical protein ACRDN6_08420 [Gaiellaceae bacterium]
MRSTRLLILAAGGIAAVVLFLALRPGGDDAAEPGTAPATTETVATTATVETLTTAETTPPPPPPKPKVVTVRITIRGGAPQGGIRRATVTKGRRVRIVVRSDVADHVHVHGYDLMRDVAPGAPARISFRASIPGRFEIELEDRGLQIAELEVRP